MRRYPIPMVAGPVAMSPEILAVGAREYGSADLEPEFFELYNETGERLGRLMGTGNQVVLMSGEAMLALWASLRSCLAPDDRVVAVATGVFGYGLAEMAKSIGCKVEVVGWGYDETISDLSKVEKVIRSFRPKMITAVHCETPSGTLNPLARLGRLKEERGVPLLLVDAVSSIGGAPVEADAWHVDLCVGGSQKCLSAPPGMCFLSVSKVAWYVMDEVRYQGYDALLPFRHAVEQAYFPYTPHWHGVAQLHRAAGLLLDEGMENVFNRHERVADMCRKGLRELSLELFPAAQAVASPTVTAVNIPYGWTWNSLNERFRDHGLVVSGSFGPLAGKVFRLGHMGSQANERRMERALEVIVSVLKQV